MNELRLPEIPEFDIFPASLVAPCSDVRTRGVPQL